MTRVARNSHCTDQSLLKHLFANRNYAAIYARHSTLLPPSPGWDWFLDPWKCPNFYIFSTFKYSSTHLFSKFRENFFQTAPIHLWTIDCDATYPTSPSSLCSSGRGLTTPCGARRRSCSSRAPGQPPSWCRQCRGVRGTRTRGWGPGTEWNKYWFTVTKIFTINRNIIVSWSWVYAMLHDCQ